MSSASAITMPSNNLKSEGKVKDVAKRDHAMLSFGEFPAYKAKYDFKKHAEMLKTVETKPRSLRHESATRKRSPSQIRTMIQTEIVNDFITDDQESQILDS